MAGAGIRGWFRGRRILTNAIRLSVLLMTISILLIVLSGLLLKNFSTWQTILFAIVGAVLQTAVLGLIYEVWLRTEVEDATLEKLGTARDVREHGLIKFDSKPHVDWPSLLLTARHLCVVSHDPRGLLGRSDDSVLQCAREGGLESLTIAVPSAHWDEVKSWLAEFTSRWEQTAPAAQFYGVRLEESTAYELIATETRSVILLPLLSRTANLDASKLLEFRQSSFDGTGSWLHRQFAHITALQPSLGYSPPKHNTDEKKRPSPRIETLPEPEELV